MRALSDGQLEGDLVPKWGDRFCGVGEYSFSFDREISWSHDYFGTNQYLSGGDQQIYFGADREGTVYNKPAGDLPNVADRSS